MCPIITVAYYVFQVFMLKIKNMFCHSVLFHNRVKCYTLAVRTGSDCPLTRNSSIAGSSETTFKHNQTGNRMTPPIRTSICSVKKCCTSYCYWRGEEPTFTDNSRCGYLTGKTAANVKKRISSAWSIDKRCLHFSGSQDAAWIHCDSFNGSCFLAGMLCGKLSKEKNRYVTSAQTVFQYLRFSMWPLMCLKRNINVNIKDVPHIFTLHN